MPCSPIIPPCSGSDSAPHLLPTKSVGPQGNVPAGVFTQPYAAQLVLLGLEEAQNRGTISADDVTQERLVSFLSSAGRQFYKLSQPAPDAKSVLERKGEKIPVSIKSDNGQAEVGISRAGDNIWSLRWD